MLHADVNNVIKIKSRMMEMSVWVQKTNKTLCMQKRINLNSWCASEINKYFKIFTFIKSLLDDSVKCSVWIGLLYLAHFFY